jgi:hypothetical protein
MPQQQLLNGDSGLSFRNKANANFTELYAGVDDAKNTAADASSAANAAANDAATAQSTANNAATAAGNAQSTANGKLSDAPADGKQYARKDGSWSEVENTGSGTPNNHASLSNLDYAHAGHTGFATSAQGARADSAIQVESDPVYTADKPNISLKSELAAHAVNLTTHADIRALINNLKYVKTVSYSTTSGNFIFTFEDNTTLTVNINLDNLAQDIDYDSVNKEIVLTTKSGSEMRVSVADLIDVYTGFDGTHIQVTVDAGNEIKAVLKAGTVSETELTAALAAKINGKAEQTALTNLTGRVAALEGMITVTIPTPPATGTVNLQCKDGVLSWGEMWPGV